MPFNPIEREPLALTPGDTVVLFSDGVSEALNTADEFYGDDRLVAALAASTGESAAVVARDVMNDVRAFAAGAKQSDDITVLAVRYAPQ
jgi:sigma-B regulation protein RsbU (phosphoserine phosphatase)